jgi:BirA family biotin operon repressor/biotin-[acetyl-CoA-carboxylase] ligase
MRVQEQLLFLLEEKRGQYLSGEELAELLGVSRNAIWKAVKRLQEDGYPIKGISGKGYQLHEDSDILSPQGINKYLGDLSAVFSIEVRKEVDSTNQVLKDEKGSEGRILVAERQASGKGRMGRTFYSPGDSGVYFSLLLRPKIKMQDAVIITAAAAVAVCEAIETVSGKDTQIKWVNDIYVDGRKVCGILTEAAMDLETGGLEYAVLGIGINIKEPREGFPKALNGIAGALFQKDEFPIDIKNKMVSAVLNQFWPCYSQLGKKKFLEGYRDRSMVTGRDIWIHRGDGSTEKASAVEIDDQCRLVVIKENGQREELLSGEVSIRNR